MSKALPKKKRRLDAQYEKPNMVHLGVRIPPTQLEVMIRCVRHELKTDSGFCVTDFVRDAIHAKIMQYPPEVIEDYGK